MDWLLAFWAGLAGGIAMGAWAMMMHFFNVTLMSVPRYLGCIMTGKDEGTGNYMTGMMLHMIFSVVIAFAYAWVFEAFWHDATWLTGLVIAVGHWILGGLMLRVLDGMNACVKRGTLPAMGFFSIGYGGSAVFTFLAGHLIFGAVVGWIYHVPGT